MIWVVWKQKSGKRYPIQTLILKKKKSSSSNINTRCKLQSRVNYQGQRLILYNDKRANPPRRHSIPECACINQQACRIYEAKPDRTERRDQQGYRRTQDHHQQNLIDVCLYSTPYNNRRIPTLSKLPWNTYQIDHTRHHETNLSKYQIIEIRTACVCLTTMESITKITGKSPNTWKLNNIPHPSKSKS